MAENPATNGNHIVKVEDETPFSKTNQESSSSCLCVPFMQKVIAEVLGTYLLMFAGCGSVVVNLDTDKAVSFWGIAIVWGLVVMVMINSARHISGAHFNPLVTIGFATTKRFPWKQVPAYIIAQVLGSTLAIGTLRLTFNNHQDNFIGSSLVGIALQSFLIAFIISFYIMFVVSGVVTDNRAIGEFVSVVCIALGSAVLLHLIFTGPIFGESMNSAIASSHYKNHWIYIVAPVLGAVCGSLLYNVIRFADKPLQEITKSEPFLNGAGHT